MGSPENIFSQQFTLDSSGTNNKIKNIDVGKMIKASTKIKKAKAEYFQKKL